MSALNLVTAPAVEPVSLAEAKLNMRVDIDDEDDLVLSDVVAGRERVELETGRQLITATWQLWLNGFPGYGYLGLGGSPALDWSGSSAFAFGMGAWMDWSAAYSNRHFIDVPLAPLQRVVSITYVDPAAIVQTWDPSLYQVSAPSGPHATRGKIQPAYGVSWPVTRCQLDAVVITFEAGYGNTAASVPQMLRRANLLIAGDFYNNREATIVTDRRVTVQELPYGVDQILQQFRMRPVSRAA